MPNLFKSVADRASGLSRQTALYAGNAFDRIFRAASLVQAGQTPFETLHSDGLVSLRYYPPLAEDFIELDWGIARLEDVSANLLAIAGSEDTMVTPGAAKRVMDHVSSSDKTFRVVPGGHMGILAGSKPPGQSWLELAEWLAVRSD